MHEYFGVALCDIEKKRWKIRPTKWLEDYAVILPWGLGGKRFGRRYVRHMFKRGWMTRYFLVADSSYRIIWGREHRVRDLDPEFLASLSPKIYLPPPEVIEQLGLKHFDSLGVSYRVGDMMSGGPPSGIRVAHFDVKGLEEVAYWGL